MTKKDGRECRICAAIFRVKWNMTRMQNCGRRDKLTKADVSEIRRLLSEKVKGQDIAKMFGVTGANISSIKKGKTWQ